MTIVLDHEFVIRGIRLIRGHNGVLMQMPSRRLDDPCPACWKPNRLVAKFCNECGKRLDENRVALRTDGTPILNRDGDRLLYEDEAHPIDDGCRRYLFEVIWDAYQAKLEETTTRR